MAKQSKTADGSGGGKAQRELSDMKPQKDAQGGKKRGSKSSQSLAGGGGLSFGPHSTSKGPAVHEN